jgi:transposase
MNKKAVDKTKVDILKQNGTFNSKADTVTDPLFMDHDFFDPQDLMQVKYEMLRSVHKDGQSVKRASSSFGFSRLSFYRIQAAFKKYGLAALISKKRGPKDARKISVQVMEFIEKTMEEDRSLRSTDLKKRIEDTFGISVHPRTIERALTRKKK